MLAAHLQYSTQCQHLDELERHDSMDVDIPDIELGDLINLKELAPEAIIEDPEAMSDTQSEPCADPAPLGVELFYNLDCRCEDHRAHTEQYARSAYLRDEEPESPDERIAEWLRGLGSD
jgi:hypothetical protein